MRTPIAWLNTFQNKKRTAAAVGGICFAILLIFMQAGFLGAARLNASLAYRMLDFDLLIASRAYLTMPRSETVDRFRLVQARSIPGVDRVIPLSIEGASWRPLQSRETANCFVFGLPPGESVFLDPAINSQLAALAGPATVCVDRNSRKSYGAWDVGGRAEINGIPLNIVGEYHLGMGLLADGSAIVSEETYMRLYRMPDLPRVNFGLIRLTTGADPIATADALRRALPSDVIVMTRAEIIHREERYFINVKPVGIMFQVGMLVAFLVGAVILYQILSSEITNRMREFATMKALGYSEGFIYSVGIQQGLLFSMLGYFPSLLLSFLLYRVLRAASGFPVYMDWSRVLTIFGMTMAMCAIAAFLALGKIKRADPAELF